MIKLKKQLQKLFPCRPLILGIGNRMRGDDGAGSFLIEHIQDKIGALCMDVGITPENFLEKIVKAKPDTLFIVDAIDFQGAPGEIRVFTSDQIFSGTISTHALSLRMIIDYLKGRMTVRVFLIGIQPQSLAFNGKISQSVSASIDFLGATLLALTHNIKT